MTRAPRIAMGIGGMLLASALAWAIPRSGRALTGVEPLARATSGEAPPVPAQVRSIAPEQMIYDGERWVLYAGAPASPSATPAPTPSSDPLPSAVPVPELATQPELTAVPTLRMAWKVSQLPEGVPAQLYEGWARAEVDRNGRVSNARLSKSCGNPAVDGASLARLEREGVTPARHTLADGTEETVAYEGLLFFHWVN